MKAIIFYFPGFGEIQSMQVQRPPIAERWIRDGVGLEPADASACVLIVGLTYEDFAL